MLGERSEEDQGANDPLGGVGEEFGDLWDRGSNQPGFRSWTRALL